MSTTNQDIVLSFKTDDRYTNNLIFVKEIQHFAIYKDNYWQILENEEIKKMLYEYSKEQYDNNLTSTKIKDLFAFLKFECKSINKISYRYITFDDCIVDTHLKTDQFKKHKHNKDKFSFFKLNFSLSDTVMPVPTWDYFVGTTLVDNKARPDPELKELILEFLGFYLFPNTKKEALFFLVGSGANGKSVLINLIKHIITPRFFSALNLESLTTDKFSVPSLIGKIVNICADDESRFVRSDKFKTLISGETISVQRKFQEPFDMVPRTKFLFSTNQMPTFENLDPGLKRRVNIIPFKRQFPVSEQDPKMLKRLIKEIPGIFGRAMLGYARLVKNDFQFSTSKASEQELFEFENEISSSVEFFRETYETDSIAFLSNQEIYEDYRHWCDANGRKPKSKQRFFKDIVKNLSIEAIFKKVAGKTQRGRNVKNKNV